MKILKEANTDAEQARFEADVAEVDRELTEIQRNAMAEAKEKDGKCQQN